MNTQGPRLILGEAEMRELRRNLCVRFTYSALSASADLKTELDALLRMIDIDPGILNSETFGSLDN